MARPGFTLVVDDKTPSLLRISGAQIGLQRFGVGTSVIYPPDPEASKDPVPLIDQALDNPIDSEPLEARLTPATRLTIVVSAENRVQPPLRIDARRTIVERILTRAARVGVEDVHIVTATGLSRSWTNQEITRILGDRVASSFQPEGLITTHDVTDPGLVTVTEVEGHPVKLNARVAQSDLVVVVGLCHDAGERAGLSLSATDVETLNRTQGFGADPATAEAVCQAVDEAVPTFAVQAVLGQPKMSSSLSFLNRREWEWRLPEISAYASARQWLNLFPRAATKQLFGQASADYNLIDVIGGSPGIVRREATESWAAAHTVNVPDHHDVVITSVWGSQFSATDPVGSPLGAAHHALVQRAGACAENSLVRPGGMVVAFHPLQARFPHRREAAAADLFSSVLPETIDAAEIAQHFEPRAMADPWYLSLYRDHFADHPLAVYHRWYQTQAALSEVSDVVWVGADRRSAALMGHRAASTLPDALEIASDVVGRDPSMLYLRSPGSFLGAVR